MQKRFLTIWFPHLLTDWFSRRKPALQAIPVVVASMDHGRLVIIASNAESEAQAIVPGMVAADARAIIPALVVLEDEPGLADRLLHNMAEWCIRFSPVAAPLPPDCLVLDITGCAHLWGGEQVYLEQISTRLRAFGYDVRAAIASTIGTSWAVACFGDDASIIDPGQERDALLLLPPASLRLEQAAVDRMQKLGLHRVEHIITLPRAALRRRFGPGLLRQIDRALGEEEEAIEPVFQAQAYQERLPCLEPISTAGGIEIALEQLLDRLCQRLLQEQKGLREAVFKAFRIDGKIEEVAIGTNRATHNSKHLFRLFEEKLPNIEPALGIELFMLEAPKTEELSTIQGTIWQGSGGMEDMALAELLDRLSNRAGDDIVHRYLPDEHHWPERSIRLASSLGELPSIGWSDHKSRPFQLLAKPEPIEVTAPVPDYPPMLFRYRGALHKIVRSDGPERIEQEWWIAAGQHRDYYSVEDEAGCRYWLFRAGHYTADKSHQWYLHGFFA